MKYMLGKIHSILSMATKVKLNLDHSETHKLNNILATDSPDYSYRLGINETPSNLTYNNDVGPYSFTHKIEDKFTASDTTDFGKSLRHVARARKGSGSQIPFSKQFIF